MLNSYDYSLQLMAPWRPYGVPKTKANGPLVSQWCPYMEEQKLTKPKFASMPSPKSKVPVHANSKS